MKQVLITTACLVLAVMPCVKVSAQNIAQVGGGLAMPVGELSDIQSDGPSFGVSYIAEVSPVMGIGGVLGYNKMSLDKNTLLSILGYSPGEVVLDGGALSVLTACLEIRGKNGGMDTAMFWASAGAGLLRISLEDVLVASQGSTDILLFDPETKLGGYVGVGVGIPVQSGLRIGGELKYNIFSISEEPGLAEIDESRNFLTMRLVVLKEL